MGSQEKKSVITTIALTLFALFISCSRGGQAEKDFEIKVSKRCLQALEGATLDVSEFVLGLSQPFSIEWKVTRGEPENFYPLGKDQLTALLISSEKEEDVYQIDVRITAGKQVFTSSVTLYTVKSRDDAVYLNTTNASGHYTGRATTPFVDIDTAVDYALQSGKRYVLMVSGDFQLSLTSLYLPPGESLTLSGGYSECWERKGRTKILMPSALTVTGGGRFELNHADVISLFNNPDADAVPIRSQDSYLSVKYSSITGPESAKNARAVLVENGGVEITSSQITGAITASGSAYGLDVKNASDIYVENSIIKACSESCMVGYGMAITNPVKGDVFNSFISAGSARTIGFGVYFAGTPPLSPLRFAHVTVMGSETGASTSAGIGNGTTQPAIFENSIIHAGFGASPSSKLVALWNFSQGADISQMSCVDFWTGRGGEQCDQITDPERYMVIYGDLQKEGTEYFYCLSDLSLGDVTSINPDLKPDHYHLSSQSPLIDECFSLADFLGYDIDGEKRVCGQKADPGADEVCK